MKTIFCKQKNTGQIGRMCAIIKKKKGVKVLNFYIADTHFFHTNILRLSKRPFTTVEEMNEEIIRNWNKVVSDKDDVYICGDFSFRTSPSNVEAVLKRLKGRKHLIKGNHDGIILKNDNLRNYFVEICDMTTVVDGKDQIFLCHYPLAEWPGFYHNVLHFFGHIHNNDNEAAKIMRNVKNSYNVGVDIIGFGPMTKDEILKRKDG